MLQKIKDYFNKSYSSVRWVLKIFWQISPFYTSLSIITNVFREIIEILSSFIFAKTIDILLNVSTGKTDMIWVYYIAGIFLFITMLRTANNLVMNYAQNVLGPLFYPMYMKLIYQKLTRMRIGDLENPEVNNLIDRTTRDSGRVERQFYELNNFLGISTALITSGGIILHFAPYLIPLFIVSLLPSIFTDQKYLSKLWNFNRNITESRRKAYDSAYVMQDSQNLHELRVTGGAKMLDRRFVKFFESWIVELKMIRSAWYRRLFGYRLVRGLVEGFADLIVFFRFIHGIISIGDVTFYIRQTSSFMGNLNSLASSANNIYESSLTISEVQGLFDTKEDEDGNIKLEKLIKGPSIEISNLTFTYPGTKNPVIRDLSLNIKSGEKIAIVGHNGAGKTTLIKLLLRFYDVKTGNIKINGHDLSKLVLNDYYKNISTLFQNFNTYGFLSVKENIHIGRAHKKLSTINMKKAAQYADVDGFVKEYENGYDQLLTEKYKGGIRPSTGQWQKIAIARFFYRNSPLVIFDEPTAAIDAVAEAKIFNKIYKFFKNKTVIIISHRFSTVRNADRIIVFDKGKIVEQGSHEHLMKLDGTYAKAFKLQAEGYK